MKEDIKQQMLSLLESRGEVSSAEFRDAMPGTPVQTVFSRIRVLEKQGMIYQSGRGRYSLGIKPIYKAKIFPKMLELNAVLVPEFEGATLCISSFDGRNILVETDRSETDRMTVFLRGKMPGVYGLKEALRNRGFLKNATIVKPLVSDAPLIETSGLNVPSIEKRLVDLVADRNIFRLDDNSLHIEFQRAFEVYPINRNRIIRYAGRRNVAVDIEKQIAAVDFGRVDVINRLQCLLSAQPVVKAWLFGSWSRMEEREDSDIDILVDFDKAKGVSLLDHIGYQQDLESKLQKRVDYVTNGTLLPLAAKNANRDKYLIYERRA